MRDAGEQTTLPSVREILALPELQAGAPEVVAGASGVDREVRWAHVAAGAGVAELLDGGELILTTGAGWPTDAAALSALAQGFVTVGGVGVAAVVLELGQRFAAAPDALIHACEEAEVPLIVLHREVRFVQITQRVHQRILAAQNEALEARAEVHAMLTELGLNRSPVDYVVERLAETLDAPVLLEDTGHRIVAFSTAGSDPAAVLAPWAEADGHEPQAPADVQWERVAVEARGRRWGFLTALAGPPHPAGRRTVLELGAFALALGRLADAEGEQWLRLGAKRMFDALLGGRYRNDAELNAQLAASGLSLDGRVIIAATLRGSGAFGGHASLERATLETALRRAVAPEGRALVTPDADGEGGAVTLLTLVSLPAGDSRAQAGADRAVPALAARLAHELDMLVPGTTPPGWRAHLALGTPAHRLRQVVASLEQVRAAGRLTPTGEVGRVTVQVAERQPLAHLVRALAGTPELQEFASDMLAPLLAADRAASAPGDLVRVLTAYLSHPTNRSLAAKEARLSRSVFYQRLALIEEVLGVDLASGETIATLTVALLARDAPG